MSEIKPHSPGDKGSTVGQIDTPMCEENVGKKNGPGVHSYKSTFHDGSGGGKGNMKTSNTIEGPGVKGQYPIKSPKETKL